MYSLSPSPSWTTGTTGLMTKPFIAYRCHSFAKIVTSAIIMKLFMEILMSDQIMLTTNQRLTLVRQLTCRKIEKGSILLCNSVLDGTNIEFSKYALLHKVWGSSMSHCSKLREICSAGKHTTGLKKKLMDCKKLMLVI